MKYKKDKIVRQQVSLLVNRETLKKVKVYCMFNKIAFSTLVEDMLDDYYKTKKPEIDKTNTLYNDVLVKK